MKMCFATASIVEDRKGNVVHGDVIECKKKVQPVICAVTTTNGQDQTWINCGHQKFRYLNNFHDYVPNDIRPLNIKLKRVPLNMKIKSRTNKLL